MNKNKEKAVILAIVSAVLWIVYFYYDEYAGLRMYSGTFAVIAALYAFYAWSL